MYAIANRKFFNMANGNVAACAAERHVEALAAGRCGLLGLVERSLAPRMEVQETLRRHEVESASAADFDVLVQEAAS